MSQIVMQIVGDPGTIHGACRDCQSNQTVCSWGKLQCGLSLNGAAVALTVDLEQDKPRCGV